ncbi:protein-lysine N-methyltransferase EEF2KMT [Phymastichus coffea]|uniref:protein-lysine N-methyltransferase EEF2KMT n=1 Tax=Phymastichus coffea TaxID=108790 RepID=UPI00273BD930|nr:protein-lysine N-methyltransferase EEF2KMT [Phymastichus coffea]XP_058800461.1 protein-lysine N-methyltransferase EEF2KMT [Phymastichus coffea]
MNDFSIELVQKQFLCCTPLQKFKWPNFSNIDENLQKQIIKATINNNIVLKYPIKHSYRKAFLKLFINKLEESKQEINDDIYNTYCNTTACSDEYMAMHYRHFILNNQVTNIISLKESTNIISEGTTGLCIWKAAFSLAEWCIFNRQRIFNKNVLELGSGVGLAGLSIVNSCSPKTYYFSDCHPTVIQTLKENVCLNLLENEKYLWKEVLSNNRISYEKKASEVTTKVEILNLNWEDIDCLDLKSMKLDVVIASDILYDSKMFEPLVVGLRKLLTSTVKYIIIAATIRNEITVSEFLNRLDKNGLAFKEETASTSQIFIQSEDTPVRLLKIFRQSK